MKLEVAYEAEKTNSVIFKRCSRIYHELLQSLDMELYDHLMRN